MHRRNFIKAATLSVAMAAAGLLSLSAFAADTIKIGIRHSRSGSMATIVSFHAHRLHADMERQEQGTESSYCAQSSG